MKNALIIFLLGSTCFYGFKYFSSSRIEDKVTESKNTIKMEREKKEENKINSASRVQVQNIPGAPIAQIKDKMAPQALKQIEQFENMGFDVRYRDNKDGTMALIVENKEKTYTMENLYKPEQWEGMESAILTEVNNKAKKTELSDEEQSIVEKWRHDIE
ncbi:MAG: hypothetical protein KBD76_10515 [Bacteriovorax sp.]|nr:hypothetical protein [Bacteriovorax sp.]